jgi:hypothetical protein
MRLDALAAAGDGFGAGGEIGEYSRRLRYDDDGTGEALLMLRWSCPAPAERPDFMETPFVASTADAAAPFVVASQLLL